MNQIIKIVFFNVIIDMNKETIMKNIQRENIGVFSFRREPLLTMIANLAHLLFGMSLHMVPIDPIHPLYI